MFVWNPSDGLFVPHGIEGEKNNDGVDVNCEGLPLFLFLLLLLLLISIITNYSGTIVS